VEAAEVNQTSEDTATPERGVTHFCLEENLEIAGGVHIFVQLQLLHKLSGREDLVQFQVLVRRGIVKKLEQSVYLIQHWATAVGEPPLRRRETPKQQS